jgi:hypothetical protein
MKNLLKKLYRFILRGIPENRLGDNFIAFISFLRVHRRLPSHRLLFNDVLYRIKTTDEIIDPLRDCVFFVWFSRCALGGRRERVVHYTNDYISHDKTWSIRYQARISNVAMVGNWPGTGLGGESNSTYYWLARLIKYMSKPPRLVTLLQTRGCQLEP